MGWTCGSRLLRVVTYCCSFVCMGLTGASIGMILLPLAREAGTDVAGMNALLVARSVTLLVGSLAGPLFDIPCIDGNLFVGLSGFVGGVGTLLLAIGGPVAMLALFGALHGIGYGVLNIASNIMMIRMFRPSEKEASDPPPKGKSTGAGSALQAMHASFAIGAFLSPLIMSSGQDQVAADGSVVPNQVWRWSLEVFAGVGMLLGLAIILWRLKAWFWKPSAYPHTKDASPTAEVELASVTPVEGCTPTVDLHHSEAAMAVLTMADYQLADRPPVQLPSQAIIASALASTDAPIILEAMGPIKEEEEEEEGTRAEDVSAVLTMTPRSTTDEAPLAVDSSPVALGAPALASRGVSADSASSNTHRGRTVSLQISAASPIMTAVTDGLSSVPEVPADGAAAPSVVEAHTAPMNAMVELPPSTVAEPASSRAKGSFEKWRLVLVTAMLLAFYVACEASYTGLTVAYAVVGLGTPETIGANMLAVYRAGVMIGRVGGVGLARCLSSRKMLILALSLCLVSSVAIAIVDSTASIVPGVGRVAPNSAVGAMWPLLFLLGMGNSIVYPTTIALAEDFIPLAGAHATTLIVGGALGEVIIPPIIAANFGGNASPSAALFGAQPSALPVGMAVCCGAMVALMFLMLRWGVQARLAVLNLVPVTSKSDPSTVVAIARMESDKVPGEDSVILIAPIEPTKLE
jgi:MFS family permease